MARTILNRGSTANDGTGDNLRNGADKINANFAEIYTVLGDGDNLLTADIDFGQNKILFSNTVQRQADLASIDATKYLGMIVHAQDTGALYYAHSNTWRKLLTDNSAGNVPSYVDSLDAVAYSGNYNDLSNRPAIPSTLTDIGITDGSSGQVLTTDGTGNFTFRDVEATTVAFANITDKPTTLAGYGINDAFTGRYEDLLNKPTLFSGSYTDLTSKPTIPSDVGDLTDNSNLLFDGNYTSLDGRPTIPSDVSDLTDDSNLFFSRSYVDLTNKPTSFSDLTALSMALGVEVDEFSNDVTMTDNSATALVTERAVKTYVANQIAAIPAPDQIGNFSIGSSIIDTDDSSAISIVPAVTMNSDLTVENSLVVNNDVTVEKDLTVNGNFNAAGIGTPELYSDTEILLTASSRVEVTQSPFKLASFTTAQRDLLSPEPGDVIYNTSTGEVQAYVEGTDSTAGWVALH